jgi:hypothetical protein
MLWFGKAAGCRLLWCFFEGEDLISRGQFSDSQIVMEESDSFLF